MHYDKNKRQCMKYGERCHMATNCRHYKERTINEEPAKPLKKTDEEPKADYKKMFPINCRIYNPKLGKGTVRDVQVIDGSSRIKIRFDSGVETKLQAEKSVPNGLLKRIDK